MTGKLKPSPTAWQLIEPMVFIILGVVVAFIILAIVLPMFESLRMVG